MRGIFLLLGGNIGNVEQTFEGVRSEIEQRVGAIVGASSLRRSEAWGFSSSDEFLNQALELESSLAAEVLLDELQAIEQHWGRDRLVDAQVKSESGERYASRSIDIDIIFYGNEVVSTPRLTLPHPLMAEREFVLEPLAEIASEVIHPTSGLSVDEMLRVIKRK